MSYIQKYQNIFTYLKKYSEILEIASIDECYMDITEEVKNIKNPIDYIKNIQKEIFEHLSLPCSIGVGSNKFLAKMASNMKKPLGITILRKRDLATKLWPLPISKCSYRS